MVLSATDLRAIERVAARLRPDCRVLFVTGAGMSADSGLPTYRGVGGLYSDGGQTRFGCTIEEALSGPMFQVRPDVTWTYLRELEDHCRGATFNRGHALVARMEQHFAHTCVLTQNVDGFHRDAGSYNVIEIHGTLRRLVCTRRSCRYEAEVTSYVGLSDLPQCPACDALIRPDVVLFGETLPVAAVQQLQDELEQGFDAIFFVGTSALFPYISLPLDLASSLGWYTVEINPDTTALSSRVDEPIRAGAAAALEALWRTYLETRGIEREDTGETGR